MELLLGLKGFRIQQIDNIRAKMPVGIGYTLIIDITQKPAAWEIQFRDPSDQEKYIYTLYCEFKEPEKVYKNATELVTAYQMALVDRVMGIEGMEVIKPPKSRARSKQSQAVEDPLPEEPVLEEMAEAMDEEPEVKAEEEKVQPEEPKVKAEEPKVKEEILPGPKISPSAAEKFYSNALKIPDNINSAIAAVLGTLRAAEQSSPEAKREKNWVHFKICSKCGGNVYFHTVGYGESFIQCDKCKETFSLTEFFSLPPAVEPLNIPDSELEKIKDHLLGRLKPVRTRCSIEKDIEAIQDTKINTEDIRAALQAEDPIRSVTEALGLIRTEEERGGGQTQKPEPFPEQIIRNLSQDGIIITKNAKGAYQWEITARSDSLNTAIEKALLADKKLREELRGGVIQN